MKKKYVLYVEMYRIMCKKTFWYIYVKHIPKNFLDKKNYMINYYGKNGKTRWENVG